MNIETNDFINLVNSPQWPIYKPTTAAYGLIPLLQDMGENIKGVEVGVCLGINSYMLLESCPNIQELIGVDPYIAYMDWQDFIPQSHMDLAHEMLQDNLMYLGDRFTFIKKTSVDAAAMFTDNELDFVFIDGNHSMRAVLQDLDAWWPKLKSGGIMSGHDSNLFSVNFAVTSWIRHHIKKPTKIHTISNEAWWWQKK
jgi:predicted O-methyltransferase YrrM